MNWGILWTEKVYQCDQICSALLHIDREYDLLYLVYVSDCLGRHGSVLQHAVVRMIDSKSPVALLPTKGVDCDTTKKSRNLFKEAGSILAILLPR